MYMVLTDVAYVAPKSLVGVQVGDSLPIPVGCIEIIVAFWTECPFAGFRMQPYSDATVSVQHFPECCDMVDFFVVIAMDVGPVHLVVGHSNVDKR